MPWPHADWLKFCIYLRSLNVSNLWTIEAMELKCVTLRSLSTEWPPDLIYKNRIGSKVIRGAHRQTGNDYLISLNLLFKDSRLKDMIHKITTLYTDCITVCPNIISKFCIIAKCKIIVKENYDSNKTYRYLPLTAQNFIYLNAADHELPT
jgi:hypothetical protein